MRNLRLTVLLICTSLMFFSCSEEQPQEPPTSATIYGKVLHPKNEFVEIQGSSDYLDTLWIHDDGTFTGEINLDSAQMFVFLHGGEYANLYLTPGDSLQINVDTERFDESLEFSGRGEVPNRYLVETILLDEKWDTKYPHRDLHELDPEVFISVIDSMYKDRDMLLSDLKKALPDNTFVKKQGKSIAYKKALQLYNYEKTRMRMLGLDSVVLPENYYAFLDDLDLNNPENLGIPTYEQFLDSYIESKAQEYRTLNPDTSKTGYTKSKLMVIDDVITDPEVKEMAYARAITQQLNYFGIEGVEDLMPKVEETIDDSTTMASINELLAKWKDLRKGQPAPPISGMTMKGDRVGISDFAGNLIYVDVWATWCGPCLMEIPYLDELQETFEGQPVEFVSVSIDDDKKAWEEMVSRDNLGGIQIHAGDQDIDFTKDYLIRSIPRFILIDEEGKIVSADAPRPSQNAEQFIRENLPSGETAMNRK